MPDKITFTSCELLSISRKKEGGKAVFKAALSGPVMKVLEWDEIPEFMLGTSLEGDLAAPQIELVPDDAGMKRHAMTLDTQRISKFETVRIELENKRGKGHRTELRFTVWFQDVKGARKLEEYLLTCGKSKLSATYTKQMQQQDLPGTAVKGDDDQEEIDLGCIACNNNIPIVAGSSPKRHESGAACTANQA